MAILPTKFYPQPNAYYISGSIEQDVAIRSTYADAYDGSGTTLAINGGSNEKFYLAQSSVPSYPRYGGKDSTFDSLQLAYYTNTMDSDRNFHTPELKIYAVNPNVELTEGNLKVIDDNLTVFCSYMSDQNTFLKDTFGGTNTGFQDREAYSKQVTTATTAASEDYAYTITSEQIHEMLIHKGQYSYDKGGRAYRLANWAILVDGGRGDNVYNLVKKNGRTDYHPVPAEDGYNAGSIMQSNVFPLSDWIAGGAIKSGKINLVTTQYNVVDVEFVERVTQFNSIFNYVREAPDTEDIKVQTVNDTGDDLKFFTYSKVALDSGDTKTGGASCAFHNFWENWQNTDGSSGTPNAYATQFGVAADGGILPQTAMASIDYLPGPYQLDIGGLPQTDISGSNNPITSPEIELEMKFEMMAPVLTTYPWGQTRLERGFSVIFAESYPEENEDYMTYIGRLRTNQEVCTGLFFYSPRENPSEKVIGIPFLNLVSGAAIPPADDKQWSLREKTGDLGRYYLSGLATSPEDYSQNGNRNYFDLPINEWLNITFKYGSVNMHNDLVTSIGAIDNFPITCVLQHTTPGNNTVGSYPNLIYGIDYSVSPDSPSSNRVVLDVEVLGALTATGATATSDSGNGRGYSSGDVITISGASVGGITGVDDIYATIEISPEEVPLKYAPKDYIMAYSKDITNDGAMQTVKLNLGDAHFGTASSGSQLELNAMSFWLNNTRANDTSALVGATSTMKNTQKDADGFTDGDMQGVVKIDSIAFKYFNWDVINASVNEINRQRTVSMPYATEVVPSKMVSATGMTWPDSYHGAGNEFGISGAIGIADNYFGQPNTITHSNISIGFDEIDTLLSPSSGGGDINLLFGDFTTGNDNTVKGIESKYISGSKSGPMSGPYTAGQGVNAFVPFTMGGPATTAKGEMNGLITSGGTLSVDDFTQKGFVSVTGLNNGSGSWTRRENIYAAARVMGSNAEGTEIIVDNPSVFDLPLDSQANGGTDYVMWKLQGSQRGEFSPLNVNVAAGLSGSLGAGGNAIYQVRRRSGNTIYLNRPTKFTDSYQSDSTLCTSNKIGLGQGSFKNAVQLVSSKRQLGNIFISPLKYWVNLHIANVSDQLTTDAATAANSWGQWFNPIEDLKVQSNNKVHSYGSILATSGTSIGTFGTTMNESLITDGQYTRSWDLSNTPNGGIITVDTDYGFGVYEETETSTKLGGYINTTFPITGNYVYSDLSGYIKGDKVTWDSIFNFSIYPMNEQNNIENYYTVNIDTKDGTRSPYLIWGLHNPPPVLSNLTIKPSNQGLSTIDSTAGQAPLDVSELPPNSLDYLQMEWDEENSEDIWYRYIIADTGPVFDKYHRASFYSHLNSGTGDNQRLYYSTNVGAASNWTDYSSISLNASGNAGATIEGFAGYGAVVDGNSNTSWNSSGTIEWTDDTDKASMMIHCIPSAGSGTIFEINAEGLTNATGSAFNLSLSGNQVRANIYKLGLKVSGNSDTGITSSTFLSGTSYLACDGLEPVMIALTYDGELPSANWKLYVDGKLEDTATYTCATGAIHIRGAPYFGGQRTPASGGTATGTTNNYAGRIEEVVGYNGIVLQFPVQNSILLDTTSYRDFGVLNNITVEKPLNNNVFQARVFAADYHNIRGRTPREMAMSNKVGWGVTGI